MILLIESWISILAYCNPIAAQWDKAVLRDPKTKCWDIATFRIFPLINTGLFPPLDGTLPGTTDFPRLQHVYRYLLRNAAHPHHLETADEAPYPHLLGGRL